MLLREWHILSAAVSVACQQSDECTLLVGGNTMRVAVSVSILNKASKKQHNVHATHSVRLWIGVCTKKVMPDSS